MTWGAGDFSGGLATRRAPVFGVTILSQALGLLLVAIATGATGQSLPSPADAMWAAAAGVSGALGISALYRGLAEGQMGIVAPVTAVVAATIPVLVGGLIDGPPGPARVIGIVLAMVAVVLVSRSSAPGGGRAGLGLALLAGTGLGLFAVFISRASDGAVVGTLTIARLADVAILSAIVALARQPWRVPRGTVPLVLLAGLLDTSGNACFVLAAQAGRLDVAAVLSSLYPVTTILLATVVLGERLVRGHAIGVALAFVAIVLIAAG